MIYKFRAILDAEDDIFRDIAIESDNSLEDLHNALVNAFGFDGTETGSFFTCGEDWAWHEEDGIPMFDTGDIPGEIKPWPNIKLKIYYTNKILKLYMCMIFSLCGHFL